MNQVKQPFYCDLYHKTGGFFPSFPENQPLLLGDFFQIQSGKCVPLGNILDLEFLEPIVISKPIELQREDWMFHSGSHQCFSLTEESFGENTSTRKRCKQLIDFEEVGSHFFLGKDPKETSLLNWTELKDELTLKMTQEVYGFREVYTVTNVVNVSSWGVLMAEKAEAKFAISSEVAEADYFHWLHESARIESSEHLRITQQRKPQDPSFFKAKKLIINEKKKDSFIRGLYERQKVVGDGKTGSYSLANWLKTDLLNLVVVNELNPATALEFFDWTNMTLDDLKGLE